MNRVTRSKARLKHKGRREGGTFTLIPHAVQDSENWRRCSATAIKMLTELARQYNGGNNGDLCGAMTLLQPRGWNSDDTIFWALRELRHYGFIVLTRQGGLHNTSLYALTWLAIDECGGKLDCSATRVAGAEWKLTRPKFKRPPKQRNATTPSGAPRYANRSTKQGKAA